MKKNRYMNFILLVFVFIIHHIWIIVEAREIKMLSVDWAPYYGSEMQDDGFITVIVKTAFQRSGHNATVNFVPWERALHYVENGKYDIVMGAYYTKERSKKYLYSDPFYDIDVGLVGYKSLGVTQYSKLEDLKQYRIGVSRGWANSEEFDAADFLIKEQATNQILNIRKLINNRVNMIVIAFGIFQYELSSIKNHSMDDFVLIQPPLSKNALHLMMSLKKPDHMKVIKDFNHGLEEIKKDGTYDKILKKYGF